MHLKAGSEAKDGVARASWYGLMYDMNDELSRLPSSFVAERLDQRFYIVRPKLNACVHDLTLVRWG